jgi:hypothetical protein
MRRRHYNDSLGMGKATLAYKKGEYGEEEAGEKGSISKDTVSQG